LWWSEKTDLTKSKKSKRWRPQKSRKVMIFLPKKPGPKFDLLQKTYSLFLGRMKTEKVKIVDVATTSPSQALLCPPGQVINPRREPTRIGGYSLLVEDWKVISLRRRAYLMFEPIAGMKIHPLTGMNLSDADSHDGCSWRKSDVRAPSREEGWFFKEKTLLTGHYWSNSSSFHFFDPKFHFFMIILKNILFFW